MNKQITSLSVTELSGALKAKEISAAETTIAFLEKTDENDKNIGAFLTVCKEEALKKAKEADEMIARKENVSALCGIPYALKDNICVKGVKTTAASKMLENFVPPYSASVYEKLEAEGAVLLGKTNLDEFGMGSTTCNSAFITTVNPLDFSRVPGGSSGGSAAAVGSGEAPFSLGSDTGGSVRQPAAYCGLVGMMPTYGRFSRYGLIPFASSLDKIGPITKNVADNRLVFRQISFHDPKDPTSALFLPEKTPYKRFSSPKEIKIGFDASLLSDGVSGAVKQAVTDTVTRAGKEGFEIIPVSLPSPDDALAAYYIISSAEAFSNLSRYDGIRYGFSPDREFRSIAETYAFIEETGFGEEVKRRLRIGRDTLSVGYVDEYYKKANDVRIRVKRSFDGIFSRCDVFLSPVTPDTAPFFNEKYSSPEKMWLSDIFTVPESLASIPSLSLPCGKDGNGLPIGIQIAGPGFSEELLYDVAEYLEITEEKA